MCASVTTAGLNQGEVCMCVCVRRWQQAILLDEKLSSKWMNTLWIGGRHQQSSHTVSERSEALWLPHEAAGQSRWARPAGQWGPKGPRGHPRDTWPKTVTIEEVGQSKVTYRRFILLVVCLHPHTCTDSLSLCYTYTHTVDIHTDTHRHFLSLCVCPEGKEYIHIQWMIGRGRSRSEPFCFSSRWQKAVAITTLWWIQGSFPSVSFFAPAHKIESKKRTKDAAFWEGEHSVKPTSKLPSCTSRVWLFNSRCTVIGREFHFCPLSFIH